MPNSRAEFLHFVQMQCEGPSYRRLETQGSDDGHAVAGANSEGDLAASENSVINILLLDEAVRVAIRRNKNKFP